MGKTKVSNAKTSMTACALSNDDLGRALESGIDGIHPVDAVPEMVLRSTSGLAATLRKQLGVSQDANVRASCATALGAKKNAASSRALIGALKDVSPEVVRRAAQSLGRIGGKTELLALRKIKSSNLASQRAVAAAKTLLCYRLGEQRGLLSPPDSGQLLELGIRKAVSIDVEPVSLKSLGLQDRLDKHIVEFGLSDTAVEIVCGRSRYLVVLNQAFVRAADSTLATKSAVLGALLRKEQVDNLYYRYAYLLTQPKGRGQRHLFAMRGSSELAYYGTVALDDRLQFNIQAINSRHTRPIALSGELELKALSLVNLEAQVGVAKDPQQSGQREPRRLVGKIRARSGWK